jgi:putative hydrolase of the HAD superfamily
VQLGVQPGEAAMVGDTLEDDVEGARALGMRAFLLDREGRHAEADLRDLRELPVALALS